MNKKIYFIGLVLTATFIVSSCDDPKNSNDVLGLQQEQNMQRANQVVGFPGITKFTQRKQLKMIQELCDQEDLICYAYIIPEMTGKPVFLGKCIGYGIPYATQYTNPEVDIYKTSASSVHHNMPQADPNGLFMPASAEGTWLMMINPTDGSVHPAYCEPRVYVSAFPLNSEDGLKVTLKK